MTIALRSAWRAGPGMHHEVLDFKDLAAEDRQALLDAVAFGHPAQELGQVRAAQRRLAAGSYGTCADCGEPIPARRLQALPATPFCTDCASGRPCRAAEGDQRAAVAWRCTSPRFMRRYASRSTSCSWRGKRSVASNHACSRFSTCCSAGVASESRYASIAR